MLAIIETKHLPKIIADHSQDMTGKVVVIITTLAGIKTNEFNIDQVLLVNQTKCPRWKQ